MVYEELKPRLSDVKVKNINGESLAIESLWASRPVLLAFLRHFG